MCLRQCRSWKKGAKENTLFMLLDQVQGKDKDAVLFEMIKKLCLKNPVKDDIVFLESEIEDSIGAKTNCCLFVI